MEISKVLIIQNKRLGDVLLSSVIATNIKKNYKECTIHFFTYDYCAPVIGNHPHIDKIITENPDRLKKIPVLLSTCRKINAEKYDAIIDPYSKFQSKFMCYSSGASVRIGNTRAGKKSYWKPYNFTVEFKPKATLPCGKSIEDRVALVDRVFNLSKKYYHPIISLTNEERGYQLPDEKKYIMIGVLGSVSSKSLPAATMAALIDLVCTYSKHTIIFNYAPHQRVDALRIYELCQQKDQINFELYEPDLRKFLSLVDKCDLVIANEGGAVHMAKALEKPTFTIYSPFIKKESWNSFENMEIHESLHLMDYRPDLYMDNSRSFLKSIEKNPAPYYHEITATMIWDQLQPYLKKVL